MLQIILTLSFMASMLLFLSLLKCFPGKRNMISRVKKYINFEDVREEKRKNNRKEHKMRFGLISRGIGNVKFLDGYKKGLRMKLDRAHILLKAEEYMTITVVLIFAFVLLTYLLSKNPGLSLLFGILGWLLPELILKSKTKSRLKLLNDQLCDTISIISNSLKAGFSFLQAIDTVSKEMSGPISQEFTQVQREISLGSTTEMALENLGERVKSDDLELIITAVLIQRQVGGNLSEVLDNISATIRDRLKIKGEIKTATAQGRMSGVVISVLPPGLGLLIFLINPEHITILFTSAIGIAILVTSFIMELTGILFIRKIIRIEI